MRGELTLTGLGRPALLPLLCGRGLGIVAPASPTYNSEVGWARISSLSVEAAPGNVMNVYSLRPRVSDLVFTLYGRPLHPELFDILAVRKVQREDYELTVRITRTGHVISWENRDVHLTEVAAAAEQELPESRRLLGHKLRGEHSDRMRCAHGIGYQATSQVEVLPPEIFLHVHDEILADGVKRGLLHNFQPHHRLAIAPLGFVAVEARADCLFISTFHTFPDEHAVVKTQSLIEKRA